jgi:hypothetical protein
MVDGPHNLNECGTPVSPPGTDSPHGMRATFTPAYTWLKASPKVVD